MLIVTGIYIIVIELICCLYLYQVRLMPSLTVLIVRDLPHNITSEEMHDFFGKYGAIRQIRMYE